MLVESGLWESITKCNPPPPAYDAAMFAIASSSVCIRAEECSQNELIRSTIDALRELVRNGLASSTASEWLQFWSGENYAAFVRLTSALSAAIGAAYSSEGARRAAVAESNASCVGRIAASLPRFSREIDAAEERIQATFDIVEGLRDLSEKRLQELDADCSARMAAAMSSYSIAMNSLTLAAEQVSSTHLVDVFFAAATGSSRSALRAAQNADDLRAVAPGHIAVLNASIEDASDGWGVVGAIDELELETCGETRREMRSLLANAVRGFFRAEKKRGALQEALSALGIYSHPSEILICLRVREQGDSQFTEMLRVQL